MNNILEKLGIYDLVAIFLTGMCMLGITIFVSPILFGEKLAALSEIKIDGTGLFLVGSYFAGLVFHELGSFIPQLAIYKRRKLINHAFSCKYPIKKPLKEDDRKDIIEYVENNIELEENNENNKIEKKLKKREEERYVIIYNYCKEFVIDEIRKFDKDQSLAASSRSLYLYFVFLIVLTYTSIYCIGFSVEKLIIILVCYFLFLLFYKRSERLYVLRYTLIIKKAYKRIKKIEEKETPSSILYEETAVAKEK